MLVLDCYYSSRIRLTVIDTPAMRDSGVCLHNRKSLCQLGIDAIDVFLGTGLVLQLLLCVWYMEWFKVMHKIFCTIGDNIAPVVSVFLNDNPSPAFFPPFAL